MQQLIASSTHAEAAQTAESLYRSDNPLLSIDLARVSVEAARSIIVLATADSPDRSDARTLRVALCLMGVHDRLLKAGTPGLPVSPC